LLPLVNVEIVINLISLLVTKSQRERTQSLQALIGSKGSCRREPFERK
jgi:hypothetical protein